MRLVSYLRRASGIAGIVLAVAAPAKADWSGLYIGASIGYQSTDVSWNWVNAPAVNESVSHDSGIMGVHAGLQHQWGQLVVGVESSISNTRPFDYGYGDATVCNVNAGFNCSARLQHLVTIGPRLGWAPNHQWLVYVSGGYAGAHINTRVQNIANPNTDEQTSAYHDGWYIGGGVEWNVHGNWILGFEYQHVELDSKLHIESVFAGQDNRVADADIDIFRVRLSYKFGRTNEAPLK